MCLKLCFSLCVFTNLNIHYYLKIHFVNLNFATDKGKPGLCLHSLGALCLLKCKISQQTNYKLHLAVLGLHYREGFSLVVVRGLLIVVSSLAMERGL